MTDKFFDPNSTASGTSGSNPSDLEPVHDFLTDDVKKLLVGIKNKTLDKKLIMITGNGSNGKTCFVDILSKIFNCITISINTIMRTHEKRNLNDLYYLAMIKAEKPDFVIINNVLKREIDDLISKLQTSSQLIERILELNTYVVIITNDCPQESFVFNNHLIKIIEFNNKYCHMHEQSQAQDQINILPKKALPYEDVVNKKAVRIISDVLKN